MGCLLAIGPDPVVAAVLSDSLHGLGIQVKTVLRREDALAALEAVQPDLVLVDVEGVGGDCPALLAALCRERPGIPVLTISKFLTGADRTRMLEAGAAELLFRPVHKEELRLRIRRLTKGAAGRSIALEGRLEDSPTWEVLQHLDTAGKAGRLSVRGERRRGHMDLAAGVVLDARCGGLRGEEAVLAFLSLHEGHFEFVAGTPPDTGRGSEPPLSIRKCLMEGAWLADEFERLRPHVPPTGAPLRLVEERLPELPDPALPWLPVRPIVEHLRAHPAARPFDLGDLDIAAPRRLGLALAWLSSVGALEVGGGDSLAEQFPSTREIARSRLLEASLEAVAHSLTGQASGPAAIGLLFEPPCMEPVRGMVADAARDWRRRELAHVQRQLESGRHASVRLATRVGTLDLHLDELVPERESRLLELAPRCARLILWVRSLLHPRLAEALIDAADASAVLSGRLVVAQPPGVRDRLDAMLRFHPRWRVVDHEPESVLGLLRFVSAAGADS